nr:Sec-independent periplasmic protein translocase [Ishige okamurae]
MRPKIDFVFSSNIRKNDIDSSNLTTELHFNEHLDEIRQRIFHSLSILAILTCSVFLNVKIVVKILEKPVPNLHFFQSSPGEYFISTLIISFYTGLLFSTPFVLSQILLFFQPALSKNEKTTVVWLFFSSIILFFLGLVFSYFLLIPAALNFFINYSEEVIEPFWSFNQYFGFVSALFFSTGLVFQVPIIQIVLSLTNIIEPSKMLNYWRLILFFCTVIGAVITPSADPITQLLLSGALFLLYYLGCIISMVLKKKLTL